MATMGIVPFFEPHPGGEDSLVAPTGVGENDLVIQVVSMNNTDSERGRSEIATATGESAQNYLWNEGNRAQVAAKCRLTPGEQRYPTAVLIQEFLWVPDIKACIENLFDLARPLRDVWSAGKTEGNVCKAGIVCSGLHIVGFTLTPVDGSNTVDVTSGGTMHNILLEAPPPRKGAVKTCGRLSIAEINGTVPGGGEKRCLLASFNSDRNGDATQWVLELARRIATLWELPIVLGANFHISVHCAGADIRGPVEDWFFAGYFASARRRGRVVDYILVHRPRTSAFDVRFVETQHDAQAVSFNPEDPARMAGHAPHEFWDHDSIVCRLIVSDAEADELGIKAAHKVSLS